MIVNNNYLYIYPHKYKITKQKQKNVLDNGILLKLGIFWLIINVVFIFPAKTIQETQVVFLLEVNSNLVNISGFNNAERLDYPEVDSISDSESNIISSVSLFSAFSTRGWLTSRKG